MKKRLCFFFVAFLLIDFTGCATKTDFPSKETPDSGAKLEETSEKEIKIELEKPANNAAKVLKNSVWDASKLELARKDFSKKCLGFGLPDGFDKVAFCKSASICVSEKVSKSVPYGVFMSAQTAEQVNAMTEEEYNKVKPYTDKLIKITERCLSESTPAGQ